MAFLQGRIGLLDAVVFCGGEPTAHRALPDAIAQVRDMGFAIGLHTAGIHPEIFTDCLPLVDWVGFDIKTCFAHYEQVVHVPDAGPRAHLGAQQLVASGIAHQWRTTWHPALISDDALMEAARDLHQLGATRWTIQYMRSEGCPDPRLALSAPRPGALPDTLLDSLKQWVPQITVIT